MKLKNIGKVIEVRDGIVIADGLSKVGAQEIVKIKSNKTNREVQGLALNLEEDRVGIVVLGDFQDIRSGDLVESTGTLPSVEVSDALLGRVLDGTGNPIDGKPLKHSSSLENMPIEKIAPGIIERKSVSRPLQTGIVSIDATTPIGKGQRQLIIGDRQTGKTVIAIDTILNQKRDDVICIYVAIGQRASKVAQVVNKLTQEGAMDYTIVVNASASEPAPMQYIAPYVGTAIAEYFAAQGRDTLVVYDDLSKHAWAYREISLLLRRPPGREAYPGDIFYLHSKLLERSVQYADDYGGGSITSLPVIETQAGDVSAYIPTNVISITDGQIYLEADLFNSGQKPAISVGLSVSRVGSSAQVKAMKQVAGQLRLDLAQYRELAAFAELGTDLDAETQKKMDRGIRMVEILKQDQYTPLDTKDQIIMIYAGNNGFLDKYEIAEVARWKEEFFTLLYDKYSDFMDNFDIKSKIEGENEEKLKKILGEFNI